MKTSTVRTGCLVVCLLVAGCLALLQESCRRSRPSMGMMASRTPG
jgi:hypothetical protein